MGVVLDIHAPGPVHHDTPDDIRSQDLGLGHPGVPRAMEAEEVTGTYFDTSILKNFVFGLSMMYTLPDIDCL